MTYSCFTTILCTWFTCSVITYVMYTWAAQKHSWEFAFELYFWQYIFLIMAVSWGNDLYLSLESEMILSNKCHHLKQMLQDLWEPLPVSSGWVPAFLIHPPFLYFSIMEASPEDDGRIWSGQILRMRWSCSTCWAPEATSGSYLSATEKREAANTRVFFGNWYLM